MAVSPTVGGDLLRLLTAGMYDNPLVVYREYVQNAADAIADQGTSGCIHIRIGRAVSRITVRDNGTGLSPVEAARRLVDVGRSTKDPATDRGFRGIGRLAGLESAMTASSSTFSWNRDSMDGASESSTSWISESSPMADGTISKPGRICATLRTTSVPSRRR